MSSSLPSNINIAASQVPNVFAASIISIAVAGLFFAGRLASKHIQRQPINISDYVLLLSLCCCLGMASVDIYMTSVGLGRHFEWIKIQDPSLSQVKQMLKVFIANEVFYDLGISSVKISILLLYQGLFIGDGSFTLASNILMGIVAAWFVGNLVPSIFSCRPISGFWSLDPNAVCIDKKALYICGSTINIATDIAILCLPLSRVIKLHLDWRRKLELVAVFLLGSFVCIISIYRFTVLFTANSPDLTWSFATVLDWSTVEVAVAIASACLPLMRPLFLAAVPKAWSQRSSSTIQDTRPANFSWLASSSSFVVPQPAATYGSRTDNTSFYEDLSLATISTMRTINFGHDGINDDDRKYGAPELMDIESGQRGLGESITVTKTFEVVSADQKPT